MEPLPRRSKKTWKSAKDKRFSGGHIALPWAVLDSRAYKELPTYAVKLMLDLARQYRGHNNGDLCAAWKIMQPMGWKSEDTLHKAKQALLNAGFIVEMRKGYRPNTCSLYALTWHALDPSNKHDVGPAGFPFGAWRANEPLVPARDGKITRLTTPAVVKKAA